MWAGITIVDLMLAVIFLVVRGLIPVIVIVGGNLLKSYSIITLFEKVGEKAPGYAMVPLLNSYYLGKVGSKDKSKTSYLGIMLVILEMIGAYVIYSICIDAFPIDFSVNLQERLAISIIKEILVFIFLVVNATVYSRIFFKFTRHGFILTLTNMLAGLGVFSPIFLYVITRKLK